MSTVCFDHPQVEVHLAKTTCYYTNNMKIMLSKGNTNEATIAFLKSHTMAALATVDEDGSPSVATIYYTTLVPPEILFITKSETAKLINMRANPTVALAISDENQLTTLQLKGTAQEVRDPEVIDKVFDHITNKSAHPAHWPPPIIKMKQGNFVVMSITPTIMKLSDYRHFS